MTRLGETENGRGVRLEPERVTGGRRYGSGQLSCWMKGKLQTLRPPSILQRGRAGRECGWDPLRPVGACGFAGAWIIEGPTYGR